MSKLSLHFLIAFPTLILCWFLLLIASPLAAQNEEVMHLGKINASAFHLNPDTMVNSAKGVFVQLEYSADFPGTPTKGASNEEIPGIWKLSVVDGASQITLFTRQNNLSIEGEGNSQTYSEFLPFSLFPYPPGPVAVDFVLTFSDSEERELYRNAGKERQEVIMPEMTRIHLEFGNFEVNPNTFKGRRWDRPFIFGNGIPEFFWSLEVGNEVIYESDYIEDHAYSRIDEVDFRWEPGTIVTLRVEDEDDIKRDFAGSTPIFKKPTDLPIQEDKFQFDLVINGSLKVETVPQNRFDRLDSLIVSSAKVKGDQIGLRFELHFREMDPSASVQTCADVHLLQNGTPVRLFLSGLKGKMTGYSPPVACHGPARTVEPFVYQADFTGNLEGYSFRVDYYVKQEGRVIELSSREYPVEVSRPIAPGVNAYIWILGAVLVIGGVLAGVLILSNQKKKRS